MSDDNLIAKIVRRVADRRTQVDMGHESQSVIARLLIDSDARASEVTLRFPVPELLKRLYRTVGNGGFGPGYGLIGLMSGATDDQGHNAIQLYGHYSAADPEDVDWKWPDGLLPICHWGCAIYSCVDCKNKDFPMVVFDPNLHDNSWSQCFFLAKRGLEDWLGAWANGTKLWDEMYDQK